jgi:hypothetical protein
MGCHLLLQGRMARLQLGQLPLRFRNSPWLRGLAGRVLLLVVRLSIR